MSADDNQRVTEEAASLHAQIKAILMMHPDDSARHDSLMAARDALRNRHLPALRLFLKYASDPDISLDVVCDAYEVLVPVTETPEQFISRESLQVYEELSYAAWSVGRNNPNVDCDSVFAGILMSGEYDTVLLRTLLKAEPVSGDEMKRLLDEVRSGAKGFASGLL